MDSGNGKLEKSMEDLGAADEDTGPGGGRSEVIQDVLQGGSAGSVGFWVRDVGPDPPHGTGPGEFSAQGQAADHQEAAKEAGGGGLVLPTAGIGYVGGVI